MGAVKSIKQGVKRRLTGAKVGIPPRHVRFSYPEKSTKRFHFYNGNGLMSAMFATFSGIFPPGEDFFVESVRAFRDQITDETLRAQVSGFIGQEALHSREHDQLNAYFSQCGFDMRIPDRFVRFGLGVLGKLPKRQQLACTTMMEHFTALLAEEWVSNTELQQTSDPQMLKLWYWHALEEMEHKSVAYDVFEQVGGTHRERVLAVAVILAFMAPPILAAWGWLVVQQGEALNWRDNLRGLKASLGRGGIINNLFPEAFDYLRKDFHPNQHDTSALVAEWREKLFGENGELRGDLKNVASL